MSINMKKLAKMLGEDEFGDTLFTQVSRPAPDEKPFYLYVDYAEDDIIINPDGSIKAGTLPALVERLTLHESMGASLSILVGCLLIDIADPTFNSTFLMTYRSFATAEEVLNLLIKRYQLQPPPNLNPEQLKDWAERKQKPVKLRYVGCSLPCCPVTHHAGGGQGVQYIENMAGSALQRKHGCRHSRRDPRVCDRYHGKRHSGSHAEPTVGESCTETGESEPGR